MKISKALAAGTALLIWGTAVNANAGGLLGDLIEAKKKEIEAPGRILKGEDPGKVARSTAAAKGKAVQSAAQAARQAQSQLDRSAGQSIEQAGGKNARWLYDNAVATVRLDGELKTTTAETAGLVMQGADPDMLLSGLLAASIRQAIEHYTPRAQPLPEEWQDALESTIFTKREAANVRYVVDDDFELTLPATINSAQKALFGEDYAVTIGDIIVFRRKPPNNWTGITWLSHELEHVRQYEDWGVDGFALQYMNDSRRVESEAQKTAREAVARLREFTDDPDYQYLLSDASW